MATRRRTTPSKTTAFTPAFSAGVHTVELPELFQRARVAEALQFNITAVTRRSYDWNGNLSLGESLDAAEFGVWDAPVIESLTLPHVQSGAQDAICYSFDVTGQSLDVATMVTGDPECWLNQETVTVSAGRIIRLAVEVCCNADITGEQLKNRGEAIIALINSLELQGHSVELVIVSAVTNQRDESYKFLLPVKVAGQALDIRRIQFMLGQPAFYRRCLFALLELAQGDSLHDCRQFADTYTPTGYIHIGHSTGAHYSLRDALDWAERFAQQLASA